MRSREPAQIRVDAIGMAIKKGGAGCNACAQGYFNLARKYGATEKEIQRAIGATPDVDANGLSRRDLFKLATVGAARVTALYAAGNLLPQMMVQTAAAQATDGAQVAWIVSTPTGQELIGVAPTGGIVGQIDVTNKLFLRSSDGTTLSAVTARQNGATSAAIVEVYSATTGTLQQTIVGQSLALGNPRGLDDLSMAASADGRFVAILHQTYYIVSPAVSQATKVDANGVAHTVYTDVVSVINGIEVFDVTAGRSLGYLKLDAASTNALGGQIVMTPDGTALYTLTYDEAFNPSVTAVQFDGKSLHIRARATNGQNGHTVPFPERDLSSATHIQPNGHTLVRVVHSTVQWFDLDSLDVVGAVDIPVPTSAAKRVYPATLFTADGSMLYVVDPQFSTVQAINLAQKALDGSITLSASGAAALNPGMPPITTMQGAALSPDGTRLYAIAGAGGDGLLVVHLPDLTVVSHWLRGVAVQAVWPTPDGQTVYVTGLADNRVYVLGTDGHLISVTQAGASVHSFVE